MAAGSWVVSAIVRFAGNGPAFMGRLAASTTAANTRIGQQLGLIGKHDAAMARYKARMAEVAAAQNAFITKASFGIAAVGATAMGYAISEAAKLQRAMTGVQIATAASSDEFRKLQGMVFNVSGMTAQSAVTIANEMKVAATSGLNDPRQLMTAFPQIAKLADVLWLNKGMNPEQSVKYATQFAHYFGAYQGKPLQNMLDDTARLMMMQPEGMERLVQQGKYFVPLAARIGIDEKTIMRYMALLGQTGLLTGRGGTGVGQVLYHALNSVALTGTRASAQASGLTELGLLDPRTKGLKHEFLTKSGAPDLDKIASQITAERVAFFRQYGVEGPGRWTKAVKDAFQTQGTQIISIIASELSQQRLKVIDSQFKKIPGVEGQWAKYFEDFFFQFNRFTTNLQNIATTLGLPTLPKLTAWLRDFSDRLGAFDDWLNAHKDTASKIGTLVAALTGLFAFRASIGALVMLTNALKAFSFVAGGAEVAAAAGGVGVTTKAFKALDMVLLGGLGGRVVALNGAISVLGASPFAAAAGGLMLLAGAIGTFQMKVAADQKAEDAIEHRLKQQIPKGQGVQVKGWYTDPTTGMSFPLYDTYKVSPKKAPAPVSGRGPVRPKSSGQLLHDIDPNHVIINVDARHSTDPKAVEHAAKRGVHAAMNVGNPRSMMASAAATRRTHPNVPLVLSVGFS